MSFLEVAQETFGKEVVSFLDGKSLDVPCLSTGIVGIDRAIRKEKGGFPKGRITEIYGESYLGKTTIALHAIANAQKLGLKALYIDVEHALDPARASKIGVDVKNLIYATPDSGENALGLIEMAAADKSIGICVLDSVAGLSARSELEGEIGDSPMGSQARLIGQFMRRSIHAINKSNMVVLFINQVRSSIGGYGPQAPQPTGGKAIKYYCSLRIKLRQSGRDTKAVPIYEAEMVKNKLSSPFGKFQYQINDSGIDESISMIKILVEEGLLERRGGTYFLGETSVASGAKKAWDTIMQDKELQKKLGL